MDRPSLSRRQFLSRSGTLLGSGWLTLNLPAILSTAEHAVRARRRADGFKVLSAAEAVELEAIAAQIFPAGATPGARDTGVIYFIDRALETFMAVARDQIREGLQAFAETVRATFPPYTQFSQLTSEQQVEALREIETTPFFGLVRFLTVAGMFALPSYGGNRESSGWQVLGFEDRHVWQPPFGYYDEHPDGH